MSSVPGVLLIEDAVSAEYEQCILAELPPEFMHAEKPVSPAQKDRASLQLHYFSPLPDVISMISEDAIPVAWKDRVWSGQECNSSIVQKYEPGEGILWHTDLPIFGNGIAILSLLSTVIMHFRRLDQHEVQDTIVLRPRSLLLFDGDAQYKWEHSIARAFTDIIDNKRLERGRRISVTMRQVIRS